jgi:hypothetical protein
MDLCGADLLVVLVVVVAVRRTFDSCCDRSTPLFVARVNTFVCAVCVCCVCVLCVCVLCVWYCFSHTVFVL